MKKSILLLFFPVFITTYLIKPNCCIKYVKETCFINGFIETIHDNEKRWRIYVSRPAQKKSNQQKAKIIINKKKKEENEKAKQRQREHQSSPKFKLIEDVISEYPYTLPDSPELEKEPFFVLKNRIQKEFLKGYELPFNLINPVKYEILKLIGRICDPFKPLCCYSLTPRLFIDKMFKKKAEVSYDEFCYNLDYRFPFYMPLYTEIFKYEKELLWILWKTIRNLKEVPQETELSDHERLNRILEDDETTLPIIIKKVNKEISNQGIHPSILQMFFDFLNIEKCDNVLKRDNAFLKLEAIKNQIKNRDFMEGIRPDYLYFMFQKKANEYMTNFKESDFLQRFHETQNYNQTIQNLISENSAYKKKRKEYSEKTEKALMHFYDIELPSFFKEYIKQKEENFAKIHEKIGKMIQRKYLKRKQKREDRLSGKILTTEQIGDENLSQKQAGEDKKKRKKKKKKR